MTKKLRGQTCAACANRKKQRFLKHERPILSTPSFTSCLGFCRGMLKAREEREWESLRTMTRMSDGVGTGWGRRLGLSSKTTNARPRNTQKYFPQSGPKSKTTFLPTFCFYTKTTTSHEIFRSGIVCILEP